MTPSVLPAAVPGAGGSWSDSSASLSSSDINKREEEMQQGDCVVSFRPLQYGSDQLGLVRTVRSEDG